jgi:hypothetical protein
MEAFCESWGSRVIRFEGDRTAQHVQRRTAPHVAPRKSPTLHRKPIDQWDGAGGWVSTRMGSPHGDSKARWSQGSHRVSASGRRPDERGFVVWRIELRRFRTTARLGVSGALAGRLRRLPRLACAPPSP